MAASVGSNGTLIYLADGARRLQLSWFDRSGKELGKIADPGDSEGVSLSPDGARAILQETVPGDPLPSGWLIDLARNSQTHLTPSGKGDAIVWSPDGTRIVYRSQPNARGVAPRDMLLRPVDGGEGAPLLAPDGNDRTPSDWSRDGRFLIYTEIDPKTQAYIWYLPYPGKPDSKPVKFLATDALESQGQLSPDGRWLAYTSQEGGASFSVNVSGVPNWRPPG